MIEPTDGYSLVSTIDMNLTKILSDTASEWFYETDENGERVRTAKSYSILAMDPNTGAIKAMVTDTDYDLNNPNDLSVFYTDEELHLQIMRRNQKSMKSIWKRSRKS